MERATNVSHGALYPLRFTPRLVKKPWGGHSLLGEGHALTPEERIGEKWLLSPLPLHDTPIANGPWRGRLLQELLELRGADILGNCHLEHGVFPLLVKLIEAEENLSVQVHPDDEHARKLGLPGGKHEMWIVLRAREEAKLYLGWRERVSQEQVKRMLREHRLVEELNAVNSQAGHAHDVPAGIVHAIGAGQLLLEIQQPSDTTYRLYDWDRGTSPTGPHGEIPRGEKRPLHIEQALACMLTKANPRDNRPALAGRGRAECLTFNEHFSVYRLEAHPEGLLQEMGEWEGKPWVLFAGEGLWEIGYPGTTIPEMLQPHELLLIPAALHGVTARCITAPSGKTARGGWLIIAQPHSRQS